MKRATSPWQLTKLNVKKQLGTYGEALLCVTSAVSMVTIEVALVALKRKLK